MYSLFIEILGWFASILLVGAYALNLMQKLPSNSPAYRWANIIGGVIFVFNTYHHQAYPSMLVNTIWVLIALYTVIKSK